MTNTNLGLFKLQIDAYPLRDDRSSLFVVSISRMGIKQSTAEVLLSTNLVFLRRVIVRMPVGLDDGWAICWLQNTTCRAYVKIELILWNRIDFIALRN